MRILLVLKRFDFGGAENHVCDLANNLAELGHDVFVLAGKGRQVIRLNPKVILIPYRLNDFLFLVNILIIFFLIKKHKIDVIHAHQRIAIFYCSILKKISKKPLVVTVHGRTRLDLRTNFTRNTPDQIIFVSSHVFNVSACYEQIKDKSVVIPNGVVVTTSKLSALPYSISYVSRIDRKHSVVILMMIQEVLPKLIIDFPTLTFNIIGEGKDFRRVEHEVEKFNFRCNRTVCNIKGFQPDVNTIFHKSSLVLGVGRVALEALACGVPVLSVNHNRLGSVITTLNYTSYKAKNFIAVRDEPPTTPRLASLIVDFFRNYQALIEETKIIQRHIKAEFNFEVLTKEVVDTYINAIQLNR
ncbi:MAG: glycosyltransferase [Bacteroidales bacterium]|nr:MAG: glycosyltransferase [Bacteroidales bacterium]